MSQALGDILLSRRLDYMQPPHYDDTREQTLDNFPLRVRPAELQYLPQTSPSVAATYKQARTQIHTQ